MEEITVYIMNVTPLETGRVKFCGGMMIRSKAKARVQVLYCVQACDHPRRYPFGIVESGGIEGGQYGNKETRSRHQVTTASLLCSLLQLDDIYGEGEFCERYPSIDSFWRTSMHRADETQESFCH